MNILKNLDSKKVTYYSWAILAGLIIVLQVSTLFEDACSLSSAAGQSMPCLLLDALALISYPALVIFLILGLVESSQGQVVKKEAPYVLIGLAVVILIAPHIGRLIGVDLYPIFGRFGAAIFVFAGAGAVFLVRRLGGKLH